MPRTFINWLGVFSKPKPKPDVVFYDGNGDEHRVRGTGAPHADAMIAASLTAGTSCFHRTAPIPEEWLTMDLTALSAAQLKELAEKCERVSNYEYPETEAGTDRALKVSSRIGKEFARRRQEQQVPQS